MSYKTKIGIALGIGVVFIIIMAVVMVIFVQSTEESSVSGENTVASSVSNSTSSNNETNTATNTADAEDNDYEDPRDLIASFGLQDKDAGTYIVGILADSTSESIINTKSLKEGNFEFENFDYDEILYLLYSDGDYLQIYSLDCWDTDSEADLVVEMENNYMNSFAVLNDNIYYVANNNSIYMYDIQNDVGKDIITLAENETIMTAEFDKENNIVYYLKNIDDGENSSGYVCKASLEDADNIEEETIISIEMSGSGIALDNIYNNYLVINFINEETEENENGEEEIKNYSISYVYDMENNNIWELGNVEVSEITSDIVANVAFGTEYMAFSDGKNVKLLDYEGNVVNDALYTVTDEYSYIVDISMITSSDIMQIRVMDTAEEDFADTVIIDLDAETTKNISRNFYNIVVY